MYLNIKTSEKLFYYKENYGFVVKFVASYIVSLLPFIYVIKLTTT